MELFDALTLARLQFAFTVSFHIIFPAFTIGLASYLAVLEGAVAVHRARRLSDVFNYWMKIFAISLRHGRRVRHRDELPVRHQLERLLRQDRPGDRAADGLRGADRLLPRGRLPRRHAVRHEARRAAACTSSPPDGGGRHADLRLLDPVGQQLDADAGGLRHQRRRASSCRSTGGRSIFNPSFPYRLVHMVLAAYLTTAFVVGAVGAFHLLRDRAQRSARA